MKKQILSLLVVLCCPVLFGMDDSSVRVFSFDSESSSEEELEPLSDYPAQVLALEAIINDTDSSFNRMNWATQLLATLQGKRELREMSYLVKPALIERIPFKDGLGESEQKERDDLINALKEYDDEGISQDEYQKCFDTLCRYLEFTK